MATEIPDNKEPTAAPSTGVSTDDAIVRVTKMDDLGKIEISGTGVQVLHKTLRSFSPSWETSDIENGNKFTTNLRHLSMQAYYRHKDRYLAQLVRDLSAMAEASAPQNFVASEDQRRSDKQKPTDAPDHPSNGRG